MYKIVLPTYVVGVTLLFTVLHQVTSNPFNWDIFGGPPPESNEPINYRTVTTLEPTPKWFVRLKNFMKRNRPQHCVEMLFPDNVTELVERHKEIKRNMTLDPSWAWRRFSELDKLKGTTIDQIPDHLKNFTFPDMSIGTYDCSKTDEKLNDYINNKVTIEEDYAKLNAKYDPYDVLNNKSIDWEHPTYDDEEFDQFLKERLGRLLLSLYACLTTGGEAPLREVLNEIDAITKDIVRIMLIRPFGHNNNFVFKHYFLDNVVVESKNLKTFKLISDNFFNFIKSLVNQFRRLELDEIESLLDRLTNNHANTVDIFRALFDKNAPNEHYLKETIEHLFSNLLNKRDGAAIQLNLRILDNTVKPLSETYEHSIDVIKDNYNILKKPITNFNVPESPPKTVNQINNVVNIYFTNPLARHQNKKRSIMMKTTTYAPPWDPEKQLFPDIKISGVCDYSGPEPLDSFYAKRAAAYDQYMKNKLFVPNNNSKSSFIFETWEYENPNKTRKAKYAQLNNIEEMRRKHEELRWQTKHNQSYQDAFQARKQQGQLAKKMKMLQKKSSETSMTKDDRNTKHKHDIHHGEKIKYTITTTEETIPTGLTLQDITNIDCWFRAAQDFYKRVEMQEKYNRLGLTNEPSSEKPTKRKSYDSSYERYKRRKELKKKYRKYSSSSLDETKSDSISCDHCRRRRRKKHRKCHRSSCYSESSESRSYRRDRRRKKYRISQSSESNDNKEKIKRSYDETSPTTTTATTRTSTTTKRKSTKPLDDDIAAEDEPSEIISDVPSHELTSYHYFKDFSLLYMMHPNVSFEELLKNCTIQNKWRTTWPWTTKKVRITKWRHPNVSWPPMSPEDDSRSSQDSYDWGSQQSWIKHQRDEMKSVEHFVRDNLFSEINEACDRLNKMNITYSGNSRDQDLELSENEDRMADFSARYQQDFRKYKAYLRNKEREYQRWSLSGGNYSTTTEFDWEIKVTKNFTKRSYRRGGKDIVFDISGLTLASTSLEQIEKNLDADYLYKYGKNRTKTTTLPTTTGTTSSSTTSITTTTTSTAPSVTITSTTYNPVSKMETTDPDEYHFEEGKSVTVSGLADMTSKEQRDILERAENNVGDDFENIGHQMFGGEDPLIAYHRDKRDVVDKGIKVKSRIKNVIRDRISINDLYVNNNKPKMHLLHELPQLASQKVQNMELALQEQLTNFLQQTGKKRPRPVFNSIKNNRRKNRRMRRGAEHEPRHIKNADEDELSMNEENFNQRAHPNHPVFYLTEEDLENEQYKKYNLSFINDKLHEGIDNMFEELKLNEDESKVEKEANSIYYRKYLAKRTTAFFNHLAEVIMGDNKRALEAFTYPPNYDFDAASIRDPEKEPELKKLKQSFERQHAKSFEWVKQQIELAKAGKLNTAQWRKEAEEEVAKLPDDEN